MGKQATQAVEWMPAALTLARSTIEAEERVVDWLAAAETIHAQALRTLGLAIASARATADAGTGASGNAAAAWHDGVAALDRLAACQRNLAFASLTLVAALGIDGGLALARAFRPPAGCGSVS